MREIDAISQKGLCEYEEQIRRQYDQISALKYCEEKDKLFKKLAIVACSILSEDLQQMIEKKHLLHKGPNLVMNSLTNIRDLAIYLYLNSNDETKLGEDGLTDISSRLCPDLVVLGGLSHHGIDISKPWAKELCKKARSVKALTKLPYNIVHECCKDATEFEMDALFQIVDECSESKSKVYCRFFEQLVRNWLISNLTFNIILLPRISARAEMLGAHWKEGA